MKMNFIAHFIFVIPVFAAAWNVQHNSRMSTCVIHSVSVYTIMWRASQPDWVAFLIYQTRITLINSSIRTLHAHDVNSMLHLEYLLSCGIENLEGAAFNELSSLVTLNPFVTSPGDLLDSRRLFRYEPRKYLGLIAWDTCDYEVIK